MAIILTTTCLTLSAAAPGATGMGSHSAKNSKNGQRKHKRHKKPRPTYWGAWIGDQLTGEQPPWDMSAVSIFESLVGKGLSLISLSSPFSDCQPSEACTFYPFPTEPMDNVRSYGAIPFFNWAAQSTSPNLSVATHMPDFQLADLFGGTYDGYIREFAEDARDWGHPFFLRFNWEMNGNWFPWSESVNGNSRGQFVKAWRHVHDIFTAVGATNATWVWCPYADPNGRFGDLGRLYPGDAYVDWTCMDGYNWANNPTNPRPWKSFDAIFRATYRQIVRRIAPRKPMILAEMASTGGHRAKARWIGNMFKMLTTRYRRIRGLIWFNQVDRGIDWPLETSPAATKAFTKGVRSRAFKANNFANSIASPIPPPGHKR